MENAGIFIQNSADVEIYGNTVADNTNAITATQQNRGSGKYGPWITRNVYVHDNIITMNTDYVGFVQDVGSTALFTPATIRFANNRYVLGPWSQPFRWANRFHNEAAWCAAGFDVTGTFQR